MLFIFSFRVLFFLMVICILVLNFRIVLGVNWIFSFVCFFIGIILWMGFIVSLGKGLGFRIYLIYL